jgi:hypothetical protein
MNFVFLNFQNKKVIKMELKMTKLYKMLLSHYKLDPKHHERERHTYKKVIPSCKLFNTHECHMYKI